MIRHVARLRKRVKDFGGCPRAVRGFLLIEVLLAMVIMTVSLTVVIHAMVQALRAIVFSVDYTIAARLADNYMVALALKKKNSISAEEGTFEEQGKDFRYRLKVDPKKDAEDSRLSEAELAVSWTAGQNEKTILVTTFFLTEEKD